MGRRKTKRMISIIVPFQSDRGMRAAAWRWLRRYYECALGKQPERWEIIEGHYNDRPFSKTRALNSAIQKSHGDILVILDADAYLDVDAILTAAAKIRDSLDAGIPLWYIPYKYLFRLTEEASAWVLTSTPCNPYTFPSPPDEDDVEGMHGSAWGIRYGAMCMIMPYEAYDQVGPFDERFVGWGGEDVSILRALDTLYARHKILRYDMLHVWHPKTGDQNWRMWRGQSEPGDNNRLAVRYGNATGDPVKMQKLIQEAAAVHAERKRRRHIKSAIKLTGAALLAWLIAKYGVS